jgi:thiamine transport system substrate-binding protein
MNFTRFSPIAQCGLALAAVVLAWGASAAELRVVTHESFDLPKDLIAQFEREAGVSLKVIKAGDAGEMVNKLILTKRQPIADVVYGIDNSLLGRARSSGILAPLPKGLDDLKLSDALVQAYPDAAASPDWLPVDWGHVTLNADKAWFERAKMALPQSLDDLAKPAYAKLLVVENPATSSPGLAFLAATVSAKGDGVWDWWAQLRLGGVKVAKSWSDAYYKEFTRNGGTRPLVVSYVTSPAAEVFYSEKKIDTSPTVNVNLAGGVFVQVEGVALLAGGKQPEAAQTFVRYLRSPAVQTALQTAMWMWPVQSGVALAPVMVHTGVAPAAQAVDANALATQAKAWRLRFAQVVLR